MRLPMAMRYCHDENSGSSNLVNDAEGKFTERVFPKAREINRPPFGSLSDVPDGLVESIFKLLGRRETSITVPD
jgi:hypothetical protein